MPIADLEHVQRRVAVMTTLSCADELLERALQIVSLRDDADVSSKIILATDVLHDAAETLERLESEASR